MIETHNDVILFAAGWNIERAQQYQYALPVSVSISEVVTLSSYAGPPITTIKDLEHIEVGAIRGDMTEQIAISKGLSLNRVHQFATQQDMLDALLNRSVDAILVSRIPFESFLRKRQLALGRFNTPFVYFATKAGFMFSRECPVQLVHYFQKALDIVIQSDDYRLLQHRFDQLP